MKPIHAKPTFRRWILAMLLTGMLFGCEDPKITPEQASPYVDGWAEQFGPKLKEQVSSGDLGAQIKAELTSAQTQESKRLKSREPAYAELLNELYATRDYAPVFIKSGKLTPKGEAVFTAIEAVPEHGLSAPAYQVSEISKELAALKGYNEELAGFGDFAVSAEGKQLVLDEVLEKDPEAFVLDESNYETLSGMFTSSAEGNALQSQVEQINELGKKMSAAQARVEVLLGMGFGRYAREMRYFHNPQIFVYPREDDFYNNPETRSSRPVDARGAYAAGKIWRNAVFTVDGMIKQRGDDLLTQKLKAVMTHALESEDIAPVLTTLAPGPQYEGLRKEYVRYKAITDAGGWPEVPAQKKLKKGAKKEVVTQLKQRLAIEGYFPKDKEATTLFDQDLVDAIKAYQSAHQMDDDGKPGKTFWRSLNVSASARTAQIKHTMKDWRASNIQHHDHDTYVIVNLPDFTTEIWKDQTRAMRMRVVIGNNDRVRDEESGKLEHANRTPTLSAYIDRVIYNPYWNVTARIRQNEILVDVRKDLEAVYKSKVDRLLGIKKAVEKPAKTTTTGTTTGTTVASPFGNILPTVTPPKAPYSSSGQWRLDIAAFQAAYQTKTGAPADVASLFPYIQPESGLVDVSTTNPANVPPWYAKNGYEVMYGGKSWEYVRQLNGAANALGKVKVIFPNMHDVYLHDTNAKALFKKTIRAYSHGCMRMHQPLDFAKWLLDNDGTYSDKIDRTIAGADYLPVFLKTHVPVHVVYFTTRVDDEGRANFLIDIYDKNPS